MAFDFHKEAKETDRLMGIFRRLYEDGAGDEELCAAAKEIFERLEEEARYVRGHNSLTQAVRSARADLEQFIEQVCTNRHAPKLQKLLIEKQKKHP